MSENVFIIAEIGINHNGDLNIAKRSCNKEQKVLKVPNTDVFRIASPVLKAKGISRIVCAENLIAL